MTALVTKDVNASLRLADVSSEVAVASLERELMQVDQAEASVIHRFGPGLYIREVSIPAGTFAIGHYQSQPHMNVMLQGRVTMVNPDGSKTEMQAPTMYVGKPGRKIGFVHEDMVWLNIYATTERDIDKLESTYLIKSDAWTDSAKELFALYEAKRECDRADYAKLIEELGVAQEQVAQQVENVDDCIEFPDYVSRVRVCDSPIDGKGLFLTSPADAGEMLAPARIGGKRTPAGRYTNHSVAPNAMMSKNDSGDIFLVSTKPIRGACGGDNGEEITIDYRQALALSGAKP